MAAMLRPQRRLCNAEGAESDFRQVVAMTAGTAPGDGDGAAWPQLQ
ncbi:hypothetical protein HIV01_013845 [Lysobacter arenosi]|uniref:Uncharacterized protein n=1 Tax=Lysobacter arenosi TaxID=2795387 RepID=A0ABX7R9T3_9GAMM|nr:hypothetical protein [Lysobacter arenosi]QSX74263.1 hypothetical protein HIV01_013845 [Lysobacter arenosi]